MDNEKGFKGCKENAKTPLMWKSLCFGILALSKRFFIATLPEPNELPLQKMRHWDIK